MGQGGVPGAVALSMAVVALGLLGVVALSMAVEAELALGLRQQAGSGQGQIQIGSGEWAQPFVVGLVESGAWLALGRRRGQVLGWLEQLAAVGQHGLAQLGWALGILGLLVAEAGVAVDPAEPVEPDPRKRCLLEG